MSEEEAEKALLALGTQLKWGANFTDTWRSQFLGENNVFFYQVEAMPFFDRATDAFFFLASRKSYEHRGNFDAMKHADFASAAAACERHHATGKWS